MTPENVSKVIDDLVGFILRYAVTLAAISALSMALIEMVKALLSWRDRFQKRLVVGWVKSVLVPVEAFQRLELSRPSDDEFHERVYIRLIQLTTGETVDSAAMTKPIEWTP